MNQPQTPRKLVPKLGRSRRAVGYFQSRDEFEGWEAQHYNSAQREAIGNTAHRLDLSVVGVFHDRATSTEPAHRSGFAVIAGLIAGAAVDTLICASIISLTRGHTELAAVMAFCQINRVRVIFVEDGIDTADATGRLLSLCLTGNDEQAEIEELAKPGRDDTGFRMAA